MGDPPPATGNSSYLQISFSSKCLMHTFVYFVITKLSLGIFLIHSLRTCVSLVKETQSHSHFYCYSNN